MRSFLAALLATMVGSTALAAGDKDDKDRADKPDKATKPSDTPPPPSCLDQSITDELGESIRPRGVQKKTFLKMHRFELLGRGGIYASDLLSSSYQYGGAVDWWLSEDLGFEITFDTSPIAVELDEPLSMFFHDPRFKAERGYLGTANALWSPAHFKMKTSGGSIVHGDGNLVLGAGKLYSATAQGIAFDGGLVVEIYPTKWVSFRFDLRDVVLVQEAVAETRLTNNISAMFGIGLWLPAF